MKFGIVARITTSLALLVLGVFALKLYYHEIPITNRAPIVEKQPIETKAKLPDFASITDIRTRKKTFFDFIRPGVISANRKIAIDRQFLLDVRASNKDISGLNEATLSKINFLAKAYRYKKPIDSIARFEQLLSRVDTIPKELVMVQAANESGWGTSRFARLGLNFFGQWCFVKGCGLIPSSRNDGAGHEVRVFDSVDASITSYLNNLNTHPAYQELRDIRQQLRSNNLPVTAKDLAPGLLNYSERQQDYVVELLQMLRHNKAYL